jgi:hypothetical protein
MSKGLTVCDVRVARCGDCHLWGRNFYPASSQPNTTCCADAVMDLPASFIPNRQIMGADDGADCICFEPVKPALAREQGSEQSQ